MTGKTVDIEFDGEVTRITERALRVKDDRGKFYWLPKSQVDFSEDIREGQFTTLGVPSWLAIEKGIV